MSMIIEHNGSMMSFREYCLSEAIKPKETQYGTNKETDNVLTISQYGYTFSFFSEDDHYYAVGVRDKDGEIVFGTSLEFSDKLHTYTDDRIQTRNALAVFSKVMYLAIEISKDKNIPYMRFDAANPALGKVYGRMIKNKIFLDSVEKAGYKYEGTVDGEYIFKRK